MAYKPDFLTRTSQVPASGPWHCTSSRDPPCPLPTVRLSSTGSIDRRCFSILKPSCVSTRSRHGALCGIGSDSSFMSESRIVCESSTSSSSIVSWYDRAPRSSSSRRTGPPTPRAPGRATVPVSPPGSPPWPFRRGSQSIWLCAPSAAAGRSSPYTSMRSILWFPPVRHDHADRRVHHRAQGDPQDPAAPGPPRASMLAAHPTPGSRTRRQPDVSPLHATLTTASRRSPAGQRCRGGLLGFRASSRPRIQEGQQPPGTVRPIRTPPGTLTVPLTGLSFAQVRKEIPIHLAASLPGRRCASRTGCRRTSFEKVPKGREES
jgi:hypothetical protein